MYITILFQAILWKQQFSEYIDQLYTSENCFKTP